MCVYILSFSYVTLDRALIFLQITLKLHTQIFQSLIALGTLTSDQKVKRKQPSPIGKETLAYEIIKKKTAENFLNNYLYIKQII